MRASQMLTFAFLLMIGTSHLSKAQLQKHHLPPPLRVYIPLAATWEGLQEALQEKELSILESDRAAGTLLTRFVEYSSGPLTASHIAKVGERPKLLDADWVRVEYQYDVGLTYIEERETLVFVNANIRALKRSFLGGDEWVKIRSNGQLEEALLTTFGKNLFGESFALETAKKGYWDRSPVYIQDADIQPRTIGPERRP